MSRDMNLSLPWSWCVAGSTPLLNVQTPYISKRTAFLGLGGALIGSCGNKQQGAREDGTIPIFTHLRRIFPWFFRFNLIQSGPVRFVAVPNYSLHLTVSVGPPPTSNLCAVRVLLSTDGGGFSSWISLNYGMVVVDTTAQRKGGHPLAPKRLSTY